MYAKHLQYIRVSDDRAILKRGTNELLLSGADVHPLLEQLLPMLDGRYSSDEIVRSFSEELQPEIENLLNGLLRRRLVSVEEEDGDPNSLQSLQASFWWNFGEPSRDAAERLGGAHVIVVGATLIARAMLRSLLESGVGRITLVDHPALDSEAAAPLLGAGLAERLTRVPELPSDDDLAAATLICATSDFGAADALLDVNRAALRVERPFLPVCLIDLLGYVGPLNHPRETACLRCYGLRRDSNNPNYEAARAIQRHANRNPSAARSAGLLPPMPAMVGELAAFEIVKFLAGFPPCDVIGRVIEINLVSFATAVRRVLKVPRCPDCSDVMVRATRAVIAGPLVPYSE